MSSPSSGSASGSNPENEDEAPAPLTQSEYAGYTALIRNLERRERSLGKRLLVRDEEGESEISDPGSSGLSSGLEEEYLPSGEEEPRRSTRVRREPQRDARRGKRTYTDEYTKDDRWPLVLRKLDGDGPSFDEVILDIAAEQIQQYGLELPGVAPVKPDRGRQRVSQNRMTADTESVDDLVIPSTLVEETKLYLNKVLVELAGLRPMDIGKRRRRMKPMDWEGVMRAATLAGRPEAVQGVGEAIRGALMPENEEISIHQSRLDTMEKYRHPCISLDTILLPVLPQGPKSKRPHQTDTEIKQRVAKRAAKEEIRQAKAEAQAFKLQQREDRRAQKKARQQARLHAIYLAGKTSSTPDTEGF